MRQQLYGVAAAFAGCPLRGHHRRHAPGERSHGAPGAAGIPSAHPGVAAPARGVPAVSPRLAGWMDWGGVVRRPYARVLLTNPEPWGRGRLEAAGVAVHEPDAGRRRRSSRSARAWPRASKVAERGDSSEAVDHEQATDNTRADDLRIAHDSDGRRSYGSAAACARTPRPHIGATLNFRSLKSTGLSVGATPSSVKTPRQWFRSEVNGDATVAEIHIIDVTVTGSTS